MQYLLVFLEGIITFISPCLLPMLPIYVSYFAGSDMQNKRGAAIKNALGFVLGFTVFFTLMGAFAGTIGSFLTQYQTIVNIVAGAVIVLFGLSMLDLFKLSFFKGMRGTMKHHTLGFFSSILFGMIFSVGWTPCVGAFLGSALMMAASSGQALDGVLMLLCYSLGLGIPFVVSAVLIDKLKSTFAFIKSHYRVINLISGGLLIVVGILMMTGLFGMFLSLLTF